jgi:hypothetical protein
LIFKSEDGSVLAGVIGPGRNRAPVGFEVTYGEAGFIDAPDRRVRQQRASSR